MTDDIPIRSCGNCGQPLPEEIGVGDQCPHCEIVFGVQAAAAYSPPPPSRSSIARLWPVAAAVAGVVFLSMAAFNATGWEGADRFSYGAIYVGAYAIFLIRTIAKVADSAHWSDFIFLAGVALLALLTLSNTFVSAVTIDDLWYKVQTVVRPFFYLIFVVGFFAICVNATLKWNEHATDDSLPVIFTVVLAIILVFLWLARISTELAPGSSFIQVGRAIGYLGFFVQSLAMFVAIAAKAFKSKAWPDFLQLGGASMNFFIHFVILATASLLYKYSSAPATILYFAQAFFLLVWAVGYFATDDQAVKVANT